MNEKTSILDNASRLDAMQQAALLDTPPEEAFDRLTRLASRVLGVPISLVSVVDKDRQFFKSAVGLPEQLARDRQTPLSHSFCKYVALSSMPMIVHDAREDPTLKDNPVIPLGVVAYAGIPLMTSDGLVLGSFCAIDTVPHYWTAEQIDVLRDLACAAMTEIELRRANAELQRQTAAKDRFIAMLSHDLRTPLLPALLTAGELVNDTSLPAALLEGAQLIQRNLELEVSLIDSLLDQTRISNGKLNLNASQADIHKTLAASAKMCSAEAEQKSIRVRLALRARQSYLKCDSAKLQQVFCNLLKNAIKFSHFHGEVVIRSFDDADGVLGIEVSDFGVGISPEVLPHVFNAFEQGEKAVTQRFGGLGLGLAISKGIVEAHGGSISAHSDGEGKGTTVKLILPNASLPPVETSLAGPKPQMVRNHKLKILLVDDHEDSLRALSRLLGKLEHRVTTATSVTAALKAAAADKFDLLISDLGLPDGTGLQLMREMLTQRPINGIALTGYGMESDIQQTQEAGFKKHLTKPINFADLQSAIQEMP